MKKATYLLLAGLALVALVWPILATASQPSDDAGEQLCQVWPGISFCMSAPDEVVVAGSDLLFTFDDQSAPQILMQDKNGLFMVTGLIQVPYDQLAVLMSQKLVGLLIWEDGQGRILMQAPDGLFVWCDKAEGTCFIMEKKPAESGDFIMQSSLIIGPCTGNLILVNKAWGGPIVPINIVFC